MAARMMSPVAIFGMPRRCASIAPCVPLPEPGAPSSRMNIAASPAPPALAGAAAELDAAFFHEPVVVAQQEMLLHLLHRIEGHADDDEQRRAAEAEGHVEHVADDDRQQRQ